jgi:hypothetical protein
MADLKDTARVTPPVHPDPHGTEREAVGRRSDDGNVRTRHGKGTGILTGILENAGGGPRWVTRSWSRGELPCVDLILPGFAVPVPDQRGPLVRPTAYRPRGDDAATW